MSKGRPRFSRAAFMSGIRVCSPLLVGLIPFGLVVGIMGQGAGLSFWATVLLSGSVYGGSSQIVILSTWTTPAPILAAAIAGFVVNMRMALMGPLLAPWLDRLRGWRLWGSLFLLADQNWALSLREIQAGRGDAAFLFGSGIIMWLGWVVTTAVGWMLGGVAQPVPGHPLFFAALAVFVSLLVPMWRGHRDLAPWVVAGLCAWLINRVLPGTTWHIAGGALAGSLAGALRDRFRPLRARP